MLETDSASSLYFFYLKQFKCRWPFPNNRLLHVLVVHIGQRKKPGYVWLNPRELLYPIFDLVRGLLKLQVSHPLFFHTPLRRGSRRYKRVTAVKWCPTLISAI
jgi:hypothetical protein